MDVFPAAVGPLRNQHSVAKSGCMDGRSYTKKGTRITDGAAHERKTRNSTLRRRLLLELFKVLEIIAQARPGISFFLRLETSLRVSAITLSSGIKTTKSDSSLTGGFTTSSHVRPSN
jgi:hypothetical protein